MESWRPVVGWEQFYRVSDEGRVQSLDRELPHRHAGHTYMKPGRLLTATRGHRGYHTVTLSRMVDGRQVRKLARVHVLVLEAFRGPCPEGMEGCHRDDNRDNNQLTNLRWDTKSANSFDAVRNGTHPQASKTRCKNNHPFDEANTYRHPRTGRRSCRACMRDIDRARGPRVKR